ncbi:MAG: hypothetical protein F6J90_01125 [Moorea sp. SIOASIH]|nr:hypothetical protein [Moorena sp. SIOASIH]NEO34978.1 hypothetical protein [Moorena sp. SIOASIH]
MRYTGFFPSCLLLACLLPAPCSLSIKRRCLKQYFLCYSTHMGMQWVRGA